MQPFTVPQHPSVTPFPRPHRRAAEPGRRAANIDVWPAAGGGLLVSLALPILRASLHARPRFGNFFLKICSWGQHALTIPYVRLDEEGIDWLVDVICDELALPIGSLRVMEARNGAAMPRRIEAGALFKAEWQLRAGGSAAKDLLLAEAAYVWRADPQKCGLRDGRIVHVEDRRSVAIDVFAAGAALQPLASRTQLRCGREIRLSPSRVRAADFSPLKDAWLEASHS